MREKDKWKRQWKEKRNEIIWRKENKRSREIKGRETEEKQEKGEEKIKGKE